MSRSERTEAGEQFLLGADFSARAVPSAPIRRPELLPDGPLFKSTGAPTPPEPEPMPALPLDDAQEPDQEPTAPDWEAIHARANERQQEKNLARIAQDQQKLANMLARDRRRTQRLVDRHFYMKGNRA